MSKVSTEAPARKVEYFCKCENGNFIYVSADKHNFSYESFRLFVGKGKKMREVQIKNVNRYRDGGTTFIETSKGTFFSPSPFNVQQSPKIIPTWKKKGLVNLDVKEYDIVEAEDKVVITKK